MSPSIAQSQRLQLDAHNLTPSRLLLWLALLAMGAAFLVTKVVTTNASNSHSRVATETVRVTAATAVTNLTVDNLTDDGALSACTAAPNDCSLRGAIANANNSIDDETIQFDATVFATQKTIVLGGTQLTIETNGSVTINGDGKVIISANNQSRVFQVNGGAVASFNGLTITGGIATTNGGGIYSFGTVTVSNSTISGNSATGGSSGGGISNEGGVLTLMNSTVSGNSGAFSGGGIHNNIGGMMNVINSTVSGNTSAFIGGGIRNFGLMNLTNVTISANFAAHSGGGVFSEDTGTLNARNSIIAGNTATNAAPDIDRTLTSQGYNLIGNASGTTVTGTTTGNILNQDARLGLLLNNGGPTLTHAPYGNSPARDAGNNALAVDQNSQPLATDQRGVGFSRIVGGTVDMGAFEVPTVLIVDTTSSASLSACTAAANDCSLLGAVTKANNSTGDEVIRFDPTVFSNVQTITGATPAGFPVLNIFSNSGLTIEGDGKVRVSGNNQKTVIAVNIGARVTLNGLTITSGVAFGTGSGGIDNDGTLNVINSTISGNSSFNSSGAGFYNRQTGTANLINSIVSGNSANNSSGGGILSRGTLNVTNSTISGNSAAFSGGGIINVGALTVTNSTISGNSASGGDGGGVVSDSGSVNLTNVTISGNSAAFSGGGINGSGSSVNSRNSIIAGNSALTRPDFRGTLISQGHNLIGDTTQMIITGDTTGNILNQNARLAPLGNYGGRTFTHALLSTSPAINAGTSTNAPSSDQRGASRTGNVDIGSFEVNASYVAALPGSIANQNYSQTVVPNKLDFTYTLTAGSLPPNLMFDGSTAAVSISGTTATRGIYNFDITADRSGATATVHFSIIISGVPAISDIADSLTGRGTPTGNVNFTVSDLETPAANLSVTATSNNQTVVPNANISLGGADGNRTINITPAQNQSGSALITVTVTNAGGVTATDTFTLTVNDTPAISDIADTSIDEDTPTENINFTVGDGETAAGSLSVSATSDNQGLVPDANITLEGSGSNRTIKITPAQNQFGSAMITVTASDGVLTGQDTFVLTVNPVNDAPTVSDIADTSTSEETPAGNINFTVGDVETAAGSLVVSASSSDQTLIPDANITLGGSDSNRTINITPAANRSGSATITVVAFDGSLTGQDTFVLTVVGPTNASLSTSMIADRNPAPVGLNFNYQVSITNNGQTPATNAVMTDLLPSQVTYTAATTSQGTCSYLTATRVVTCNIGTIGGGATVNLQITVKPREEGTLNNTVNVAADPDAVNGSASVNGLQAIKQIDLSVQVTAGANPVFAGQHVTYTMVVKNNSTVIGASGIVLTENLPASLKFVSASTSQGSLITPPVGSTGVVTANIGSLSASATATVSVTVATSVSGAIANSAAVTGTEQDPVAANNSDSVTLTVTDAALQKVLLAKQVLIGGCENTTGNVYLTGPAPAGGLTVTLSSNISGVTVPASVNIPGGALVSAAFPVTTNPVAVKQVGLVTATNGSSSVSRGITINVGNGSCQ